MDETTLDAARRAVEAMRAADLTIYDSLTDHSELYLTTEQLQAWLGDKLAGLDLKYPPRTRSKVLKQAVARELGFAVPGSFRKTRPRFVGQNFDTYVQKANNLQVWNDEIDALRRYVVVGVNKNHRVDAVRVITGKELARLDITGTLTSKYQAKIKVASDDDLLGSPLDTDRFRQHLIDESRRVEPAGGKTTTRRQLLPIAEVFRRLRPLVGSTFPDPGQDQDRNRGAALHALIQTTLGGAAFVDTGQFPDVPNQLLEVKLQTAQTVDLGLVDPDGEEPLPLFPALRPRDVRYAVVYASTDGRIVRLDRLVMTTGANFFTHFMRFGGLGVNKKRQIRLPRDFFGRRSNVDAE